MPPGEPNAAAGRGGGGAPTPRLTSGPTGTVDFGAKAKLDIDSKALGDLKRDVDKLFASFQSLFKLIEDFSKKAPQFNTALGGVASSLGGRGGGLSGAGIGVSGGSSFSAISANAQHGMGAVRPSGGATSTGGGGDHSGVIMGGAMYPRGNGGGGGLSTGQKIGGTALAAIGLAGHGLGSYYESRQQQYLTSDVAQLSIMSGTRPGTTLSQVSQMVAAQGQKLPNMGQADINQGLSYLSQYQNIMTPQGQRLAAQAGTLTNLIPGADFTTGAQAQIGLTSGATAGGLRRYGISVSPGGKTRDPADLYSQINSRLAQRTGRSYLKLEELEYRPGNNLYQSLEAMGLDEASKTGFLNYARNRAKFAEIAPTQRYDPNNKDQQKLLGVDAGSSLFKAQQKKAGAIGSQDESTFGAAGRPGEITVAGMEEKVGVGLGKIAEQLGPNGAIIGEGFNKLLPVVEGIAVALGASRLFGGGGGGGLPFLGRGAKGTAGAAAGKFSHLPPPPSGAAAGAAEGVGAEAGIAGAGAGLTLASAGAIGVAIGLAGANAINNAIASANAKPDKDKNMWDKFWSGYDESGKKFGSEASDHPLTGFRRDRGFFAQAMDPTGAAGLGKNLFNLALGSSEDRGRAWTGLKNDITHPFDLGRNPADELNAYFSAHPDMSAEQKKALAKEQGFTVNGDPEVDNLHPRLKGSLGAMFAANPRLRLNSGYRDNAKQAAMHQAWKQGKRGAYAAPPGMSKHNRGMAADIGPRSEYGWLKKNASKFGLKHPDAAREPWHVEPPGGDTGDIGGIISGIGSAVSGAAGAVSGAVGRVVGAASSLASGGGLSGAVGALTGGGGASSTSTSFFSQGGAASGSFQGVHTGHSIASSLLGFMETGVSGSGLGWGSGTAAAGSGGGGGGPAPSGTGGQLSAKQVYDLAKAAGFSDEAALVATSIAKRESGFNAGVMGDHNNPRPGCNSYGLMQINVCDDAPKNSWYRQNPQQLLDAGNAMKAAFEMSGGGSNWGPWGMGPNAYRSGVKAPDIAGVRAELGMGDPLPDMPLPTGGGGCGCGGSGGGGSMTVRGGMTVNLSAPITLHNSSPAEAAKFVRMIKGMLEEDRIESMAGVR